MKKQFVLFMFRLHPYHKKKNVKTMSYQLELSPSISCTKGLFLLLFVVNRILRVTKIQAVKHFLYLCLGLETGQRQQPPSNTKSTGDSVTIIIVLVIFFFFYFSFIIIFQLLYFTCLSQKKYLVSFLSFYFALLLSGPKSEYVCLIQP